ncbi:RNA ligase [Natronomonas sp. EA1]|uniref:RNA ligase n=1 Tax=Natronomonas sp. EA1 TaxID=3421655 RepID=UPI003EBBBB98
MELSRSPPESIESHLTGSYYRGRKYRYLPKARSGIPRGTSYFADGPAIGFPKVPRALVAETAFPQTFDGRVWVEEKLNGYNVRLVRVAGFDDPLALTRSGRVCPYTTSRLARTLSLDDFFEAHPDAILCGEVVGHEAPYTDHAYPDVDSMAFRAFDVRDRRTGTPLPVEDRRDRLDEYGLPQVPLLGVFDAPDAGTEVRALIADLHDRGREGVVAKSADGETMLKYTTSYANQGDLRYAFSLPFECGRDFIFRRVIREAFQAVEEGEDGEALRERAHGLGESILCPTVEAIRAVQRGDPVGERHTVRGTDAELRALLDHLEAQGLDVAVESRSEGALTFRKLSHSTMDKCRYYLDGGTVTD